MKQSNITDFYKIQKIQLTATGIWPVENKSAWLNMRFLSFTVVLFTAFYIAILYEAISDLTDLAKLSKILYIFSNCTAYVLKLWAFILNKDVFLIMLSEMDKPILASYPVKYDAHIVVLLKIASILSKIYLTGIACIIFLYGIYPIVDQEPLPMPFPKDLGPYNPIMYVIQVVGIGIVAWNNSALDTLCGNLLSFIAGEFYILGRKIKDVRKYALELTEAQNLEETIKSKTINRTAERLLHECIEHHLAIIRFAELTDQVFSIPILWQFAAAIVLICNSVFSLTLATPGSLKFLMLVTYLWIGICELTFYCWFGNEVILKSEEIRDACYMSDWTESNSEIKRCLFMIMERSKKPIKITAYKFSVASLASFKWVMQCSYSYYTLLRRVSAKDK